jgi:hypothetical protein
MIKKRSEMTPDKLEKARAYSRAHSKSRYGLTPAEFTAILEKQNLACKICSDPLSPTKQQSIHVDHCYRAEKELGVMYVRGVLCRRCNQGIGAFRDDTMILQSAIDYLRRTAHPDLI